MFNDLWNSAKERALKLIPNTNDSAVLDGIMMWISIAVMLVVFLPVLNAVLTATPVIAANTTLNTTQSTITIMVGNSYGLLVVVLIIFAAVILLGVISYLRGEYK